MMYLSSRENNHLKSDDKSEESFSKLYKDICNLELKENRKPISKDKYKIYAVKMYPIKIKLYKKIPPIYIYLMYEKLLYYKSIGTEVTSQSRENNDEEQYTNNIVLEPADSEYFYPLNDEISSQNESIWSKFTITNDKVEYKINIVDNKKYHIVQNHENSNYSNFKKQKYTSETKFHTSNYLNCGNSISIEYFFLNKKSWDKLDKINQNDPTNKITYMIYGEILNSDAVKIDEMHHFDIKLKIVDEAKKNKDSYFTVMLALEEYLKSSHPEIKVIFCEKSSLKTEVSLKIISTGFAFQKFKCTEKIKSKYLDFSPKNCKTFYSIIFNEKNYQDFYNWLSDHVSNLLTYESYKVRSSFKIKTTSISKLIEGGISVEWDTYEPYMYDRNKKAQQKIKISPYFKKFYLSIEDFDTYRGNIKFQTKQQLVYRRGNYPYFLPYNCSRYSIKVLDKFDSGNNQWLSMINHKDEWCSAFFGLYNINLKKNNLDKDLSIFNVYIMPEEPLPITYKKNELKNTVSVNMNENVGYGILCTPYMSYEVDIEGYKYAIVFQCRLNPKKIKITPYEEYWMMNKFSDVRPYGIILVPKYAKKSYPHPEKRFSTLFSFKDLKEFFEKKKNYLNSSIYHFHLK